MSSRTVSLRLPIAGCRRAISACLLLLLAGCVAGFPPGPPDAGVLPERITVLSVDVEVVDGDSTDPDVLLTFHVRNDAQATAQVSVHVKAFQGTAQVGQASSHDNPRMAVRREATIGVRLDHPDRLEDLDCYEYVVEALIDGHRGLTAPVRRCLR